MKVIVLVLFFLLGFSGIVRYLSRLGRAEYPVVRSDTRQDDVMSVYICISIALLAMLALTV